MPDDTAVDPRWAQVRRCLELVAYESGPTVAGAVRLALARADQFDGLVTALQAARQFIRNGCEFGYIRMPERPDSALDTLPLIEAALAGVHAVKETCR